MLGGTAGGGQGAASPLIGDAGVAVFGDRLEAGRDVEQSQLDSFQEVFERFVNDPRS